MFTSFYLPQLEEPLLNTTKNKMMKLAEAVTDLGQGLCLFVILKLRVSSTYLHFY